VAEATDNKFAEISGSNPTFKKLLESMSAFRKDGYLWMQFSEYQYDSFMMGQQRKKAL
jgi:TRAP-type mannitol/chloroaromatic compound transport system substrate-binding protein